MNADGRSPGPPTSFVYPAESRAREMLVGGDEQRKWNKWYAKAIPEAERRYLAWMEEQYGKDVK